MNTYLRREENNNNLPNLEIHSLEVKGKSKDIEENNVTAPPTANSNRYEDTYLKPVKRKKEQSTYAVNHEYMDIEDATKNSSNTDTASDGYMEPVVRQNAVVNTVPEQPALFDSIGYASPVKTMESVHNYEELRKE